MKYDSLEAQNWPENGLERVECCPICGKNDRKLLHEGLTDKVFFCAPGKWSLYKCTFCGAGYLDPRPTLDTIALAYDNYYTHAEEGKNSKRRLFDFKLRLRNGYLNSKYNTDIKPTCKIGKWITLLWTHKKMQIDENIRHLPTENPGTLADIGCGSGKFIRTATELGWTAWGVDPDPLAVKEAQRTGATIIQGELTKTQLPSNKFDYVTLSHTIEHVHNPIEALQEVLKIVKPGGKIWLATPNLEGFGHAHFGSNWRGLEPPRHLVIFTRKSLEIALLGVGFEDIKYKPCAPKSFWFYQSSLRISLGYDPYDIKAKIPKSLLALKAFILDLRASQAPCRCETITLTATKPNVKH